MFPPFRVTWPSSRPLRSPLGAQPICFLTIMDKSFFSWRNDLIKACCLSKVNSNKNKHFLYIINKYRCTNPNVLPAQCSFFYLENNRKCQNWSWSIFYCSMNIREMKLFCIVLFSHKAFSILANIKINHLSRFFFNNNSFASLDSSIGCKTYYSICSLCGDRSFCLNEVCWKKVIWFVEQNKWLSLA